MEENGIAGRLVAPHRKLHIVTDKAHPVRQVIRPTGGTVVALPARARSCSSCGAVTGTSAESVTW